MEKGHKPYSKFYAEHMFEKTETEKLTEMLDELIKRDPEHAPAIIAGKIGGYLERENRARKKARKKERKKAEKCIQEERQLKEEANERTEEVKLAKQELERKNIERKNRNLLIFAWLAMAAVLTPVFEYFFPYLKIAAAVMIGGVFSEVIKVLWEAFVNRTDPNAELSGEVTYGMVENLKCFVGILWKKGVLQMTGFCLSLCITAGVLAYFEVCEGIVLFCRGGSTMLAESRDSEEETAEEKLQQGEQEQPVYHEMRQYLKEVDEELRQLLIKTQVTQSDLDMLRSLSQEELEEILFLGEDGIGEALSQEQMDERIFDRVNALLDKKAENIFDKKTEEGGAPQSIRNQISRVSDAEKEATDFSEIREILIYRESINSIFPKRTLTQLVSNGCHHLALLLYCSGGEEITITYYYGQSILYALRCLEYADNTGISVREKLLFIAQRYEDITYTCPDFQDNLRAGMLATAFRHAAERF